MLLLPIILVIVIVCAFFFVLFFKYHIEVYIISDAMKSKSSLIPLTLFSSSYKNENYITELNKEIYFSDDDFFIKENWNIAHNYLKNYCFEIESPFNVDDFRKEWILYIYGPKQYQIKHEDLCNTDRTLYRIIYPVPIIFNGEAWTDDFIFSVYEFNEQFKEDEEKKGEIE